MLRLLHKTLSRLCNPRSTMVVESDSPHEPPMEQLEDDLCSHTLESIPPEKSSEPSMRQPHTMFRLPQELLCEIFATVCHADFHKFRRSVKNRHNKTTALTLGRICREWRDIVWSTPAIWSHVFLCLSLTRYDAQVKLLEGWLNRSGVHPLSLNFCFHNEGEWSNKKPPMDLIILLSSTSYRWRVIDVVIPEGWYQALNEIMHNIPILVDVSTQSLQSDCALSPSKRKPFTLFKHAPVLKAVHLNGYYLSDVSIPWGQLRHLTLQYVYLDECFFGLMKSPDITACRIYTILKNDVNRVVIENDILLELLEEMFFFGSIWDDTERLFSHLITPLLHTLEISTPQDDLDLPKIPPLLLKSGSHLLKLKLDAFTFTSDEVNLLELLCNIPTLHNVEISMNPDSVPISNLFIDLLKLRPSSSTSDKTDDPRPPSIPYFLPNLEMFTFSGPIDAPPGFSDLLLEVLRLRRNLTPGTSDREPFPFFWLDIKTDTECSFVLPAEMKDKLQELVDDGLHLSVVFNGYSWL